MSQPLSPRAAVEAELRRLYAPDVKDVTWDPDGLPVVTFTDMPGRVRVPCRTLEELDADVSAGATLLVALAHRALEQPGSEPPAVNTAAGSR